MRLNRIFNSVAYFSGLCPLRQIGFLLRDGLRALDLASHCFQELSCSRVIQGL